MAKPPAYDGQRTPWRRAEDPFRDARPLDDLAVLIGGLPDDRELDEILGELRRARLPRPQSDV